MLKIPYSYNIYHDFIESYLPSGLLNIDSQDPIICKLESLMEENDQMLIVMDLTQLTIIYTSKRSMDMLGIEPETNDPLKMMSKVHPEDLHRFGLGRSKLMDLDKNLYIAHKGAALLSTDIRMLRPDGEYAKHLFQCYMFYSPIPHESVYYIQVNTNIEEYIMHKATFHYYVGDDITLFRFPTDELLNIGHYLTHREFEIIHMISKGLNSEEIAEKLFISVHTVNTHRRNILGKTEKGHISDVIFDLMGKGLL
ncbi:MAG: LuxR C-terminal-related transcriptional regulator [Eudoraea sp.]|uniref:LuxR C-terminal-related transcriptional regulator n=1 Tax=Eudoraea sp. TaxID=1979955 RepID=UPI003C7931B4